MKEWMLEHTGGNCFALALECECGHHGILITNDSLSAEFVEGEELLIGLYEDIQEGYNEGLQFLDVTDSIEESKKKARKILEEYCNGQCLERK